MPTSPSQLFAEISSTKPPGPGGARLRRAVVLGASMAGLMAARVLSEHADEVLIIERDGSSADGTPRPGVPQGTQVHALLSAGAVQLDRWFPGFSAEAIAAGSVIPPSDGSRGVFYQNGQVRPNASQPDLPILVSTRPFLETLVRRKTLAMPNVSLVTGRAEGLVFEGDAVRGARYLPDGADEITTAPADLVVDAMGRSSRLSDWLEENGWQRPPMLRMPIKLNYATAMFKHDENITEMWSSVSTAGADPETGAPARTAGFLLVEGDRTIMLISGYNDDKPSRDFEDYKTRCRRDFPKEYGDIAEQGQLIGEVVTYHQADSRRRDFNEVTRFPAGLVAAGDAVASFNPVYGQGMTSAILHASCLSAYLHENPALDQPARSYFDRVRVIVDVAWQISTFADLDLPHVDGPYPRGYRLLKWFAGLMFKAASVDPKINDQMALTTQLLAHPNTMARPGLLLRALWVNLTGAKPKAATKTETRATVRS
jgi:2-polyprenyl-6-methoxyphenol hydroxylase-like FAD-dependent oxidoreductase